MLNKKEMELLERIRKEEETVKKDIKKKLSEEEMFALKGGMGIAIWECSKVYDLGLSEEFFEEINKFIGI